MQTGVGAVLNAAAVEAGATVLVLGAGGIGLSVVQGARVAGASRIVVSDPLADRRDAAKALGPTDLLDPGSEDVVARALEITGGIGVDYAFETAGLAALYAPGLAAARRGGALVCVGAPPLEQGLEVAPAAAFLATGKRILSTVLGYSHASRDIQRFHGLWRAGRLDLEALITARRPLDEIDAAMDDLRAGRGIRTVLTP